MKEAASRTWRAASVFYVRSSARERPRQGECLLLELKKKKQFSFLFLSFRFQLTTVFKRITQPSFSFEQIFIEKSVENRFIKVNKRCKK